MKLSVNGGTVECEVEPRTTLLDLLRDDLGLTGTHAGCEQGACGACTVLVDGRSVRSCLLLAVQAGGTDVQTIEGLAVDGVLHPLQVAFSEHHGLQCGYCTPGMIMSAVELLATVDRPTEAEIQEWMAGNLCRCTGYTGILDAIASVAGTAR